jgi:Na+/proline symporter
VDADFLPRPTVRASLFADYSHTVVLYALILTFAFTAYATSDKIGSPTRMFELLQEAAVAYPVEGNAGGSYLTMRSLGGGIFGILNIIGTSAPLERVVVPALRAAQLTSSTLNSLLDRTIGNFGVSTQDSKTCS